MKKPASKKSAVTDMAEPFRLMIESISDYPIIILNPDGDIVTWNPGAERIHGYSAEEIIGQHFSRFYSAEDKANGKPQKDLELAEKQRCVEAETWRLRKNGSRFWALVVTTALYDETGKLVGFGQVTRDLTDQKKTEDRMRQSSEQFRMLTRDRQLRTQIYQAKDAALFALGLWLAHVLRAHLNWAILEDHPLEDFKQFAWLYVIIFPGVPLVLEIQGFYQRQLLCRRRETAWMLFKGCAFVTFGVILVMWLFKMNLARLVIVFFGIISFVLVYISEELLRWIYKSKFGQSRLTRRTSAIAPARVTTASSSAILASTRPRQRAFWALPRGAARMTRISSSVNPSARQKRIIASCSTATGP